MNHVALAASAALVVVLVLALVREVRLQRALQILLKQLLSFWRNRDENPVARPGDADDDAAASDERFRQLAQQALYEQSEQNKRLAEQSKPITEASRRLIEGDTAARKDLLEAQEQLTSELHTERADLDRQREEMELERRNIAAQRHRDPLVVQAISTVGLTLVCLLPLLLAGYVVFALNRSSDDTDALTELLIMEMTADQPLLLPSSLTTVATFEHTPPSLDAPEKPNLADDQ